MLSKMMFRRPQNDLETDGRKNSSEQNPAVPDELCVSCLPEVRTSVSDERAQAHRADCRRRQLC